MFCVWYKNISVITFFLNVRKFYLFHILVLMLYLLVSLRLLTYSKKVYNILVTNIMEPYKFELQD